MGDRYALIFENFPIRHIFLKFYFFKYKDKKGPREGVRVLLFCVLGHSHASDGLGPNLIEIVGPKRETEISSTNRET